VTVSFSKYLPWKAMHILQHSTHFSKTCCRPLIPLYGWESPEIAWGEIRIEFCVRLRKVDGGTPLEHPPYSPDLAPCDCWAFPTMKRELRGKKFRSTFSGSGWSVVRSASLAKGCISKKRPSPHLHKVPTRINQVSPRTFHTALVQESPRTEIIC
jgi:hypothetical protein